MPVYEYQCGACSHEFEEWQKITSDPIKTCPKCGKDEVQRLISQTAFQLKGGGWYKDLYSSSGKKDKSAGDTKGSGDGASNGKSEAKSESKSDSGTKSESKSDSGKASASSGTSSGSSGGSGGTASNK